jgi:type II secretory pathway component PulM
VKLREIFDRALAWFDGLSDRERWLVGSAGGLGVIALLYIAVVLPLGSAQSAARERASAAEQQLAVMQRMRRDFDQLHTRLASVESRIQQGQRGNMRTTLENLARKTGVAIQSMEPQATPQYPRYRETKVELGLEGVSLEQAVKYLNEVETHQGQALTVKSLRMRKRPDKSELLDVSFSISAFEPV